MKKLLMTLTLLMGFVVLNPAPSVATVVKCPPGKCYSASWGGCIPCRYIKNVIRVDKQVVVLTGLETKLVKQYKASLLRLKRISRVLKSVKAKKARLLRAKASLTRAIKSSKSAPLKR